MAVAATDTHVGRPKLSRFSALEAAQPPGGQAGSQGQVRAGPVRALRLAARSAL